MSTTPGFVAERVKITTSSRATGQRQGTHFMGTLQRPMRGEVCQAGWDKAGRWARRASGNNSKPLFCGKFHNTRYTAAVYGGNLMDTVLRKRSLPRTQA